MIGAGDRIGDYRVVREIGEGGMAWVYQVVGVHDHPNRTFRDRTFALKLMKPQVSASDEFVRRFEREADLQIGFQHPALLTIFDYGRDPEHGFYYTMTWVEGTNLSQKTKRDGPLPLERVGAIYSTVLSALHELHTHDPPVIHRDVKPSNILLAEAGHVFLSDLGVARIGDGSEHTRTTALLGTAHYLSPEQARGRDVDPRSDLYSVGLSLYHSLTGHSIYEDIEDVSTGIDLDVLGYLGHLERIQEELELAMPESIPAPLARVIRRATRINPDARYQSAAEMRGELDDALREMEALQPSTPHPATGTDARDARSDDPVGDAGEAAAQRGPHSIVARVAMAGAVVLAAALLYALATPWQGEGVPSGPFPLAGRLEQLEASSGRALERAAGRRELAEADRAAATELRTWGADFAAVARTAHTEGRAADALRAGERAGASYEASCARLQETGLSNRASEAGSALRARVERLRAVGAPTYVADHWGRLEARLGALVPATAAADACAAVHQSLDRLDALAAAEGALVRVEQELEPLLPEIAGKAHERALASRDAAAPAASDSETHHAATASGQAALAAAQQARDEERWLDGTERAMEASAAFERSAWIARADLARQRAQEALAEVEARQIPDTTLRAERERADRLYAAGGYAEATQHFERIARLVEGTIEDAEQSRAARQTAIAADRGRELAVEAWAAAAAPELFEHAETLRDQGSAALAEQRYTVARAEYERAAAAYERATVRAGRERKRAEEAAAAAAERAAGWGETSEVCALSPDPVRASCEAGFLALELGRGQLAESRPLEAIAHFEIATSSFARAARQQRELEAGLPPSATIVARSPATKTVRLRRGESLTLSVEAEGRALDYLWLVDGEPQAVAGPSLAWTLESDVDIAVQVDDDDTRTEPVTASWRLRVRNTPPQLSLAPESSEDPLVLRVGSAIEYRADASDRDDDPIQIEYVVGDRIVRGERFTFEARKPGRYRMEVSASDGQGETVIAREIVVEGHRWWQR